MRIQWLHKASRLWRWFSSLLQIWLQSSVPTWVWSWFWTWLWSWLARWSGVLVFGARQLDVFAIRAKDEETKDGKFVVLSQREAFRKDSLNRRHSYGR